MDTLKTKTPYMPQEQIDWLARFLTKNMEVFEWGSGGSTLFMARRVKSIISIEYGRRWFLKVAFYLFLNAIFNCRLKLILPESQAQQSKETEPYRSTGKYSHLTFKKYVETIDSFPDEYFDFILIDGRCRVQCLRHSGTKIKTGGYILLDDVTSERPRYMDAVNAMTNFEAQPLGRCIILRRLR